MTDRLKTSISGAFYFIALAAQLSGYTNVLVAYVLIGIATLLLVLPARHYISEGSAWAMEIKSSWPRSKTNRELVSARDPVRSTRIEIISFFFVVLLAVASLIVFSSPFFKKEIPTDVRSYWPPLSAEAAAALYLQLNKMNAPTYGIEIECGSDSCKELAASFFKVFKELGWTVVNSNGGVLAAGTDGILVHPQNATASKLTSAIFVTTPFSPALSTVVTANELVQLHLIIGRHR